MDRIGDVVASRTQSVARSVSEQGVSKTGYSRIESDFERLLTVSRVVTEHEGTR